MIPKSLSWSWNSLIKMCETWKHYQCRRTFYFARKLFLPDWCSPLSHMDSKKSLLTGYTGSQRTQTLLKWVGLALTLLPLPRQRWQSPGSRSFPGSRRCWQGTGRVGATGNRECKQSGRAGLRGTSVCALGFVAPSPLSLTWHSQDGD